MALSAELEKMLALITEPAEREARRVELTELSENGLRQADYSRKMNEVDAIRKTQEEQRQKNVAWYDKSVVQYNAAIADLREAQEKISTLESSPSKTNGSFEDEDELQKQLSAARKDAQDAQKKLGDLTNTVNTFDSMIKEGKLITADKFNEEVNRRGDALGAAVFDIIDLQDKHRKDFGSDLDRGALLQEAQKRGGSLKDAYEVVTSKVREEKLRKEIEAQVEQKWQEKMKNTNMPFAQDGEPILGPLQARLQKKDTGIPDDVQADGSGRLASLMAAELRQEGKS